MTINRTARVQSLKAIQGTLEWLKTGSVCALAAQDSGHPSYNHSLKISGIGLGAPVVLHPNVAAVHREGLHFSMIQSHTCKELSGTRIYHSHSETIFKNSACFFALHHKILLPITSSQQWTCHNRQPSTISSKASFKL